MKKKVSIPRYYTRTQRERARTARIKTTYYYSVSLVTGRVGVGGAKANLIISLSRPRSHYHCPVSSLSLPVSLIHVITVILFIVFRYHARLTIISYSQFYRFPFISFNTSTKLRWYHTHSLSLSLFARLNIFSLLLKFSITY